jgi:hypothetical protein
MIVRRLEVAARLLVGERQLRRRVFLLVNEPSERQIAVERRPPLIGYHSLSVLGTLQRERAGTSPSR